jgi:hypothetical protein
MELRKRSSDKITWHIFLGVVPGILGIGTPPTVHHVVAYPFLDSKT